MKWLKKLFHKCDIGYSPVNYFQNKNTKRPQPAFYGKCRVCEKEKFFFLHSSGEAEFIDITWIRMSFPDIRIP